MTKEEEDSNPVEEIIEEAVVKKRGRGRPRKNKTQDEPNKKKRGRKPKEIHNIELNDVDKQNDNSEKEIVLHLPISKEDIKKFKKNKSTKMMDTTTEKTTSSPKEQNTNIFTITDMSYDASSSDSDSDVSRKLKEKDEIITKLKKEIDDLKKNSNRVNNAILVSRATKVGAKLIDDKTGNIIVPEKTNLACPWCTERHGNVPSYLIMKYKNGQYYALDIPFCSDNCKCAFSMKMGDYDRFNRHSINVKYRKETSGVDEDIALAPPQLALDKFGGPMTIKQFRENSLINDMKYRLVMPPMKAIVPIIEETTIDGDPDGMNKSDDKTLVLKRSKPLPQASNSLIKTLENINKKL